MDGFGDGQRHCLDADHGPAPDHQVVGKAYMFAGTVIFVPGLICTEMLFRDQIDALAAQIPSLQAVQVADTTRHTSIAEMAAAALRATTGAIVPVGLSMGGYVAMEMARQAPDRVAGIALLSTNYRADDAAKRTQRLATIEMAKSAKFRGVTRHLMRSFLSPAAMQDEAIIARVQDMAAEIGSAGFVRQQEAILGRQDQSETLRNLTVPTLILCGLLDTLTPPHLSEEMHALVPNSRLTLLPEIGHLSSMEAPAAVTKALIALLADL